jgi:hypothetical protein
LAMAAVQAGSFEVLQQVTVLEVPDEDFESIPASTLLVWALERSLCKIPHSLSVTFYAEMLAKRGPTRSVYAQ